jgi:hypothetical protein
VTRFLPRFRRSKGGNGIQVKTYTTVFYYLALAVCLVFPIQAQQSSETTTQSTSSPSTGSAPFKIAVIKMEAFYDPEKGITSLIRIGLKTSDLPA